MLSKYHHNGGAATVNTYEITFIVDEVPDHLVDRLIDTYDATTGHDHAGRAFITLLAQGPDFMSAAKAMYTRLQTYGLCIQRASTDLASRSDIATRLGVTRQAVFNWTKGSRLDAFPHPANAVSGGVWLWGDVYRWAVQHGVTEDLGIDYPTQDDLDLLNGWIVGRCRDPWRVGADETLHRAHVAAVEARRSAEDLKLWVGRLSWEARTDLTPRVPTRR